MKKEKSELDLQKLRQILGVIFFIVSGIALVMIAIFCNIYADFE